MKTLITALCLLSSVALAEEPQRQPLTINQCMVVFNGLSALSYVGQQLGDPRPVPQDAKQYKLGDLRIVVGMNLAALQPIIDTFSKTRAILARENGITNDTKPDSPEMAKFIDQLQHTLDKPCPASVTRIKLSELHSGDGPDNNSYPPPVIAALNFIIDR